jgi:uncharacterized protein (TIGR02421 family)
MATDSSSGKPSDRPHRESPAEELPVSQERVAQSEALPADTLVVEADAEPQSQVEPSIRNEPWRSRKEVIAGLSARLVEGQRGINVLQALRWDPATEQSFHASRNRELPGLGPDHWSNVELGFEPITRIDFFEELTRQVDRELGRGDELGEILKASALQYADVVRMLLARGTQDFYRFSKRLYGSPKDEVFGGRSTVRNVGIALYDVLTRIVSHSLVAGHPRDISADVARDELKSRFATFFSDVSVDVTLDDDLMADAVAGSDYVKLRTGARFSARDIDVLEVHEGWVHVATNLNGQAQPVARWLSKGPPRTTATQEGLAALMEILTGRSHVERARKLSDRILAVDKAEEGASFLEVFEWFRTEGYSEEDCFGHTRRVFRGGILQGGAPFTKDACYGKGLADTFEFIGQALETGHVDWIPVLFVGKVSLDDIPILANNMASGIIKPPIHMPVLLRDPRGLIVLFACFGAFGQLRS